MLKSLLIRWFAALVLVMLTYNPTSFNFVQWAIGNFDAKMSIVILVGLVLLVAYVVFLRATFRSIGYIGIGMVVAVIAVLLWVLNDMGWLDPTDATVMTWIGLIGLSVVLGIGLSWSIIRRRLSGQFDMDQVGDNEE
ncbi:MAG: DUF6524 family protein [Rhodobacteraceae bacterium]|nr:DUF6524 family protein [Paracoccaceae bacterium]